MDWLVTQYKSVDQGESWRTLIVATGQRLGFGVQAIGFVDGRTGWIGGFFTGLYGTEDGGESWHLVPIPDRMINRFEKVGTGLMTGGSRGILRWEHSN